MSVHRRVLVTVVAFGALTVLLAACGGGSSKTGTATATGAQFQARLNLAKCFRAHGINVPDPTPGGGPAEGGQAFRRLRSYPQAQIDAARQGCQQYFAQAFPQLSLTPAQRAQRLQQLTKFAQCMRAHGINIPDPTPNTNGFGGAGFGRQFRSIDRNSPAFQSAMTACQSLRPQRPGGGGPGAGPGGGGPPGA
jgi:hypothetical protein